MSDAIQAVPVVQAIGWALVHFIWQGAAIAAAAALLLRGLAGASPSARCTVALVALATMAAAPIATFVTVWSQSASPASAALLAGAVPARVAAEAAVEGVAVWPTSVEPLLPLAVSIWMVGVIVLSVRLALSCRSIGRLTRTTREVNEAVAARVRLLSHRLGLRQPVRVLESAVVRVPAVVGSLRPVMLLPASVITGLPAAHLDAVIAHELAHLRRLDHLVNAAQAVVETVLFYHPAVWWCSRQVRIEREHCCDDLVVEACGDRLAYATALARLEELRGMTPALVLSAGGGRLIDRVRRLLAPVPGAERRSSAWAVVAGLVTAFALIAAGPALSSRVVALAAGAGGEQVAPAPPRAPQPSQLAPVAPAPPAAVPPAPAAPALLTPPAGDWADLERQFEASLERLTAEYEQALRQAPFTDIDPRYTAELEAALEQLARETEALHVLGALPALLAPPAPPGPSPVQQVPQIPQPAQRPQAPQAPAQDPQGQARPQPAQPSLARSPQAAPQPPQAPRAPAAPSEIERALESMQRTQAELELLRRELVVQQEQLREHERAVQLQRRTLAEMEAQIAKSRADSRAATSEQLAEMRKLLEETYRKQIDETREKAQLLRETDLMELRKQFERLRETLEPAAEPRP